MVMVRLKGVHVVRARLAGGGTEYHYAWRGGPRLAGVPGSTEYVASFRDAHEGRTKPKTGTLRELIAAYKAAPAFTKLGAHTKRAYRRHLDQIQEKWGDLPLKALDDPNVRRHFLTWRDGLADKPRTADMAIGVLKRLLGWGVEYLYVKTNQAEPIARLHSANRSESIWSDDDFAAFDKEASKELRWAVRLAAHTGLRQGDLVSLCWRHFDGSSFALRTSKRGVNVIIPATQACRELLKEIPTRQLVILTTERGHRRWTTDGLRSSFGKTCAKAGVNRTFHDLRRTACTNLLRAGLNASQVAMMMGWSEDDVEALKRRYVSRSAVVDGVLAQLDKGG